MNHADRIIYGERLWGGPAEHVQHFRYLGISEVRTASHGGFIATYAEEDWNALCKSDAGKRARLGLIWNKPYAPGNGYVTIAFEEDCDVYRLIATNSAFAAEMTIRRAWRGGVQSREEVVAEALFMLDRIDRDAIEEMRQRAEETIDYLNEVEGVA